MQAKCEMAFALGKSRQNELPLEVESSFAFDDILIDFFLP
jgi:hypothetical protein